MSDRHFIYFLKDIYETIESLEGFVEGITFEEFIKDVKTKFAVMKALEIIGEASNKIPQSVKNQKVEIDWGRIIRTRHIIVHDYFKIDEKIVWKIITVHIPVLKQYIAELINQYENAE